MILYAAILAVVDVSDKYILNHLTFWQTYVVWTLPLCFVLLLPILAKQVRRDMANAARNLPAVIVIQVFNISASFSFLKAASLAPIALVSALGTLQPVFVFFMTLFVSLFMPWLLKEVITSETVVRKMLGIACVVIGAIILSL